jgi:hypothetical protein
MKAWLRMVWPRCRAVVTRALAMVRKDRLDRDFDEELNTHLELLVEEGRRRGMSHTDARHEALRKLGRPVALREVHREQRGMPLLDVLAQDLRYAVRMLTELGIRMALGAGRGSVIRESLRDTMLVFGAGLAAGIVAAVAAVRLTASFISDLLFGLTAADAANVVGAIFVMVVVAVAACILPARRATRIDPLAAIRHE